MPVIRLVGMQYEGISTIGSPNTADCH